MGKKKYKILFTFFKTKRAEIDDTFEILLEQNIEEVQICTRICSL